MSASFASSAGCTPAIVPNRSHRAAPPDAGDEDRDKQRDRQEEQRHGENAVAVVVDARRHEHRGDPECGPRRLLREKGGGVVSGVERADAARAVHHDQADPQQGEHHDEQGKVVPGGARKPEPHRATGAAKAFTSSLKRSPRSSADENTS